MVLKELEDILQGNVSFTLQARDENGYIKDLDHILPYEIRYLPANLRKMMVLRLDVEEKIIFLKSFESLEENEGPTSEKESILDIEEEYNQEQLEEDESLL
jgi:hypothetical protein